MGSDVIRAVVLGGAACVWDDLRAAPPHQIVIATNDAGAAYPHKLDHWVTLHPGTLRVWKEAREAKGYDMDFVTWSRRDPDLVDRTLEPWGRMSSGGFGAQVAVEETDADEIVLCGVPMNADPHFFDPDPWGEANLYWKAWLEHADKMKGKVYSMSGRTRELLGAPPGVTA